MYGGEFSNERVKQLSMDKKMEKKEKEQDDQIMWVLCTGAYVWGRMVMNV